ncbi:uncharacterized protein LOC117653464 isoform X2 [Thrips palmi]|uniref:Uncharacterized protein LOC117653464 isoform X2 n=1 Tax=Thrips palmi TaxID=161013 RepID=A0A6P9ACC3_THRPL|nr:uncharacterized protein LOC117653464 isoform X2 [Thrips palmi]
MDEMFITPANKLPGDSIATSDFASRNRRIYVLNEFNCRLLRDCMVPGTLPFLVIPSPTVELVFQLCSVFQLPPEVKYLALEIFDRFISLHYIDLWAHTYGSSTDRYTQKKTWFHTASRVKKQTLLRILSSIQIASKFVFQPSSMSLKHVRQYLLKWGHHYSLMSMYLSELRVFSTLDCKVPMYSMYDFTKALLEGLQYWANVSELHYTTEKVLEFSFLERDEIYHRYFRMSTNRWEPIPQERLQFANMQLNRFLMASSVVVSSLYIHHLEGLGPNKASEILSELGCVNSNDIRGLAIIIVELILGSTIVSTSCG